MDEMIRRDRERENYTRQPDKPVKDPADSRPDDESVVPLLPKWRSLTDRERRERWPIG